MWCISASTFNSRKLQLASQLRQKGSSFCQTLSESLGVEPLFLRLSSLPDEKISHFAGALMQAAASCMRFGNFTRCLFYDPLFRNPHFTPSTPVQNPHPHSYPLVTPVLLFHSSFFQAAQAAFIFCRICDLERELLKWSRSRNVLREEEEEGT